MVGKINEKFKDSNRPAPAKVAYEMIDMVYKRRGYSAI
jgi:hypothetical protein